MESEINRLEHLYARYLDAEATEAEEQELRTGLKRLPREALTPPLRTAAEMFGGFEALRAERMPQTIVMRTSKPHTHWRVLTAVGAGIAAAVALGLFFTLRTSPYGYIDGQPVTDRAEALAATIYFEQLGGLSQSFDIADKLFGEEPKK